MELRCRQPRNDPKPGGKPGTGPSPSPSEGGWPCRRLDLGLPAPRLWDSKFPSLRQSEVPCVGGLADEQGLATHPGPDSLAWTSVSFLAPDPGLASGVSASVYSEGLAATPARAPVQTVMTP